VTGASRRSVFAITFIGPGCSPCSAIERIEGDWGSVTVPILGVYV